MIGLPPQREGEYIEKVMLWDSYGKMNFYLLPFVKPSMVKMIVGTDKNGNNLSYDETVHKLIQREAVNKKREKYSGKPSILSPCGKGCG